MLVRLPQMIALAIPCCLPAGLAVGLLALSAMALGAQESGFDPDDIAAHVARTLARDRVPGAAVSIVRSDGILFLQGFGNDARGGPVDENEVSSAVEAALGESKSAKLIWRPTTTTELDPEGARKLMRLIEVLEDADDIQRVTAKYEIPDAVMAALQGPEKAAERSPVVTHDPERAFRRPAADDRSEARVTR